MSDDRDAAIRVGNHRVTYNSDPPDMHICDVNKLDSNHAYETRAYLKNRQNFNCRGNDSLSSDDLGAILGALIFTLIIGVPCFEMVTRIVKAFSEVTVPPQVDIYSKPPRPLSPEQQKQLAHEDIYFNTAPSIIYQFIAKANWADLINKGDTTTDIYIPDAKIAVTLRFVRRDNSSDLEKMGALGKNDNYLNLSVSPKWETLDKRKFRSFGFAGYLLGGQGKKRFIYAILRGDEITPGRHFNSSNLILKNDFVNYFQTEMKKTRDDELKYMQYHQELSPEEKAAIKNAPTVTNQKPVNKQRSTQYIQTPVQPDKNTIMKNVFSRQATRHCPRVV